MKRIFIAISIIVFFYINANAQGRYRQVGGEIFNSMQEVGGGRAIRYYDKDQNTVLIEIFHDDSITDYGDTSIQGTLGWAMNVFDNQTTDQGEIYMHTGTYLFTTPVQLTGNIHLHGQGISWQQGTVLKLNDSVDLVTAGTNGLLYWAKNQATDDDFIQISNIALHGNESGGAVGSGIHITTPNPAGDVIDMYIQNVGILYFSKYGIYGDHPLAWHVLYSVIEFNGCGVLYDSGSQNEFIGNKISANNAAGGDGYGLYLKTDGTSVVSNLISSNPKEGIRLDGGTSKSRNLIQGNKLVDNCTDGSGYKDSEIYVYNYGTTINGNQFEPTNNKADYGIYLDAGGRFHVISGNAFSNSPDRLYTENIYDLTAHSLRTEIQGRWATARVATPTDTVISGASSHTIFAIKGDALSGNATWILPDIQYCEGCDFGFVLYTDSDDGDVFRLDPTGSDWIGFTSAAGDYIQTTRTQAPVFLKAGWNDGSSGITWYVVNSPDSLPKGWTEQ